jgi:hypothetical protein
VATAAIKIEIAKTKLFTLYFRIGRRILCCFSSRIRICCMCMRSQAHPQRLKTAAQEARRNPCFLERARSKASASITTLHRRVHLACCAFEAALEVVVEAAVQVVVQVEVALGVEVRAVVLFVLVAEAVCLDLSSSLQLQLLPLVFPSVFPSVFLSVFPLVPLSPCARTQDR